MIETINEMAGVYLLLYIQLVLFMVYVCQYLTAFVIVDHHSQFYQQEYCCADFKDQFKLSDIENLSVNMLNTSKYMKFVSDFISMKTPTHNCLTVPNLSRVVPKSKSRQLS